VVPHSVRERFTPDIRDSPTKMPSTGAVGRDWRWVPQTIKFKVRLCARPLFAGAMEYKPQLA
jgi:hypothetical protein